MNNDFTIVTAVTRDYLDLLYWGMGSWVYKPQLRGKPLIVYYNGMKEHRLHFIRSVYPDARFIYWDMPGEISISEKMFSSFVFGAVRDVKTPYYMKFDADAYCVNDMDIWNENDFNFDLVGHKWGYTKPGYFIDILDNYYNGTNNNIDKSKRKTRQSRIESYCCLHRTEWVKNIASKFNGRLPVPSHDTTLWYYANKEGKWQGKNLHDLGALNCNRWKSTREIICSGDIAFNPLLNKELISHVQIEITSRCNIGCIQCDRNCGAAPAGPDMELDQIWKFVEDSIKNKKAWNRIDIIGGEPTLHHKLDKIIEMIGIYIKQYPHTKVRLSTNGLGDKCIEVLKTIPSWINIRNSGKVSKEQHHSQYRDAPVDSNITHVRACSVPWRCGMGLTYNGYFPCGAGASLARIFGLDIGIKNIVDLNPDSIKKQMLQLCKYCGHSNSMEKKDAVDNSMSKSWQYAIDNYNSVKMSKY